MYIDTTEGKAKLANLRQVMPDCTDHVATFAGMVGARLNREAVPSAVGLVAAIVMREVETGKAPPSQLDGLPPMCLSLIDDAFDTMIEAVFPTEFATEALAFRAKVRGKAA